MWGTTRKIGRSANEARCRMSIVCQEVVYAHATHRTRRVPAPELRDAADEEDVLREDHDQHRNSIRTD